MGLLQGIVLSQAEYASGGTIGITFQLTNSSADTMYVLKWFTPLEGIWSDCLRVLRNGIPVPYDGPLVKRGIPTENDVFTMEPGQTISKDLKLDEAYEVSIPGAYRVLVESEIHSISMPEFKRSVGEAEERMSPSRLFGKQAVRQPMNEAATNFQVRGISAPLMTLGQKARGAQPKQAADVMAKAGALKSPTFNGGSSQQQAQAGQAHSDGYKLAQNALAGLANDNNYLEWFGLHSAARFQAVKGHYAQIITDIEQKIYTYDLTGQGCGSGVFAYTYKGSTTIWLCDQFWAAPATGTDSKAGTIVHEHSHASAYTDDVIYGQNGCRQLAINDPDKAVRNADSHEYYAKG